MIPREILLGPITIHLYGLIIAIAIFLGWFLAKKRAHLYKIPHKIFDDPILLIPLLLGIVGARLYHVFDYWDLYSRDPIAILYIGKGGLGIWGGLLGAILGFIWVAKVRRIDIFSALDLVSPSLLLGQVLGRIGNFINQEGFGPPTEKPWAVFIDSAHRPPQFLNSAYFHPTFFYEAIIDAIFLLVLLYFSKKLKARGQLFAFYLILYSTGRFIAEFWRIDTATIGSLKVAHILSILTFLFGLGLLLKCRKTPQA